MNSNFARITTDVIYDLASRRQARQARVQSRLDEGKSPTLPQLMATKAALCEKDEREIAALEARQVIYRAAKLLREAVGDHLTDAWLRECMSKGEVK